MKTKNKRMLSLAILIAVLAVIPASAKYIDAGSVVMSTNLEGMSQAQLNALIQTKVNEAVSALTIPAPCGCTPHECTHLNYTNTAGNTSIGGSGTDVITRNTLINAIWPVGSIYITVDNVNPATRFPGTAWQAWGAGQVPVGVDTAQTEFNTVQKTGGAKTSTGTQNITLDQNQLPNLDFSATGQLDLDGAFYTGVAAGAAFPAAAATGVFTGTTRQTHSGVSTAHASSSSNDMARIKFSHSILLNGGVTQQQIPVSITSSTLQPYVTCYMWRRTG